MSGTSFLSMIFLLANAVSCETLLRECINRLNLLILWL